jgi:hypothetical protein
MAEVVEIPEGWSAGLTFDLKENGELKDLTGMTMTAEAIDRSKNTVILTGDLTTLTATAGRVRLTPDTGDFSASGSPYELRFKGASGIENSYFPSGQAVVVKVRRWP